MALFKIFKGNQTDNLLNSNATGYRTPTDGYAYYDTSTKLFYIDADYRSEPDPENPVITRQPINAAHAGVAGSALNGIFYGTCSTAASTKTKVATLTDDTGFTLVTGVVVLIKFSNASAESPMTLNVNSTGAKNLYQYATEAMGNGVATTGWRAGAVVPFVYTGTAWHRFYWSNTAVTQAYSTTNNSYPLLMSATAGVSSTGTRGSTTSILNNQIYANPSTGILTTKGLETNSIKFENGCEIRSNAVNNFYFRVQEIQRNAAGKPVDAQGKEKTEDDKNDFVALGTYINTVVATDKALRPPTSHSGRVDLGDSEALWRDVYAITLHGNLAWSEITSTPTTLSGYGITDAKISNGTITLGNNSITPLTSHQSLSGYIPKSTLSKAYDIMYSSAANTPTRLAANTTTTKKFLSMTGTGTIGAAPAWNTVSKSDVGLSNVDNTSDINKPISTAVQNALNNKVDKESGKGLSTNDYTNEDKTKVNDSCSVTIYRWISTTD